MSDPNEQKGNQETPDGMVRKTRRVRKKRKSGGSSRDQSDAVKLFSKAKELLIGMQDEDENYGPVDVAEQLRRLKKNKEDDMVLDDVWGTKKKSTTWLWFVLIGLITSIVALVIGLTEWVSSDFGDDEISNGPILTPTGDELEDGPTSWFTDNSTVVLEDVVRIIEKINGAKNGEDIQDLIRESPYRTPDMIDLKDWESVHLTNAFSGFGWDAETVYSSKVTNSNARGYLSVRGKMENGGSYVAYFVSEDGKTLLDWDATVGWSEKPLIEIVDDKPRKQTLLRCKIKKHNSYDRQYGEKKYSGYLLSGTSPDQFFIANIDLSSERGKVIDEELRRLLNFGSFVTDRPPLADVKTTLRVQFDREIGEDGTFLIVDYLNEGWVTP